MEMATKILGHAPTGLAAKIVDRGSVIVANDANYPPQSSIDKTTGKMVGFDVDVAKKMGEMLDLKVNFKNPAWETIPTGLNQGSYDVSIGSMTITPERRKQLDFTEPYYYTSGQLFVKKGGPQVTDVGDLGRQEGRRGRVHHLLRLAEGEHQGRRQDLHHRRRRVPGPANGNLDFVMTAGPTGQQAILSGSAVRVLGPAPLLRGPLDGDQEG